MTVFTVVFLRFEQTTNYKIEFRGRCGLAMDDDKSGLCFSAGQGMKTTFHMETCQSSGFCCVQRDQVLQLSVDFLASDTLCSPLDLNL